MSKDSGFTRTFPPWKSGTNVSGVPVCWLIIAGHFEQTSHRQNMADYVVAPVYQEILSKFSFMMCDVQ
jgi:hypothetical protein